MIRTAALAVVLVVQAFAEWRPAFELVQVEAFAATGGQAHAWADIDLDDDLDYFVGFRGRPNRLYLNTGGSFRDVALALGVADEAETRAAAWGDFDADGDADLYVGFADPSRASKVYRNEGKGARFVDVAATVGLALRGVSRQAAWIDYDGDGDLDFFAAVRDGANRLVRNDKGSFVDVTEASGVGDTRRTVSAVWWDFDRDGLLDLFVANQEGDANGLYRQKDGRFTDMAQTLGVAGTPRPKEDGSVGPSLADFDLDGDIDLFVANYGPSTLYRNDDGGGFVDVARERGIDLRGHGVTSAWGDVDNNGYVDLYVANFIAGQPRYRDAFFLNEPRQFRESLFAGMQERDATHGVRFVDFDQDGRLDVSMTNNDAQGGGHALWRNTSAPRGRALAVEVVDGNARRTRAGAEVRAYVAGARELLASAIVDSGSSYCSQSELPVHLGIGGHHTGRIDLEITTLSGGRRHLNRVPGIDVNEYKGRSLRVITTR